MLTIGKLSQRSEVKVPTIRYYEEIGLMPEPERTDGNQRRYASEHLERLSFIRHARDLGFSIGDIRELLSLQATPDAPCTTADHIANRQLEAVRARIHRLQKLETELQRIAGGCCNDAAASCNVLLALSEHNLCNGEH